jgi:hypothetical protein
MSFGKRSKIRNQLRELRAAEKELRTGHLSYRKWNGCAAQDRKSKMEGVNPRGRAEGKQKEDDYTGILHSRMSEMLKNG